MVAGTVRIVCSECKRKTSGRQGDAFRKGCPHCGGQLREIRFTSQRRRRK